MSLKCINKKLLEIQNHIDQTPLLQRDFRATVPEIEDQVDKK